MIPIVCIANNNGMLFNMRRCSRDSVLIEKLLEMIGGEEIMIEKVIICRWNRDYPADFFFDLDMADFHLKGTMMEFQGSSHERITIEEWVKNEKEA